MPLVQARGCGLVSEAGVLEVHSRCSVNAHANSTPTGVCAALDSVWPAGVRVQLLLWPLDVTHCQALRGFSKPIL